MRNPRKSKSRKGIFPYTNFISSGLCKCSLTAGFKKNKYIYYHCSGSKGKCRQAYIRQEALEAQFSSLLEQIRITPEIKEIILSVMKEDLKEKIDFQNNQIGELEKQIKLLQKGLYQCY